MIKSKFPSLYTIVKTSDLETLTRYFETYPETLTTTQLTYGKQLALIEQALIFEHTQIIKFLVDKTPTNQLAELVRYFISNLKTNNDESGNINFNYFCERIFNEIELIGSDQVKQILPNILIDLCGCGFFVHDKIITDFMSNRLLDLSNKLVDPNFKWRFESEITGAPIRVYQLIIKYYQEHQIHLAQLLACFLLGSNDKKIGIIKLFKSVDLKTYVKISNNSDIQVQLSTLFVVSGAQAKLSDLLANPNFEYELLETIRNIEPKYYYDSHLKLSYVIQSYWSITHGSPSSLWIAIDNSTIEYLKLFKTKLTNNFWNFLLEINEATHNEFNKNEAKILINKMIKQI